MIYANTFPQRKIGPFQILQWKLGLSPREEEIKKNFDLSEYHFPKPAPDLKVIHDPAPDRVQVTWIGHSSFLIQHRGRNILTDPIFGDCLTPIPGFRLKRESPPGLTLQQLPPIHEVLISHNHYDHLDVPTVNQLARLSAETRFWVPSGLGAWFRRKRISNVRELAWWTSAAMESETELHAVPAQHFAARGPFDRDHTHWCGWVLRSGERTIYYAGDSGYSPEFKEIGRRFGEMDCSLIPIGAYNPQWIMRPVHANPEEAVKIHQDVRSRFSIGCHWGTFRLTDEPLFEPPAWLNEALAKQGLSENHFRVMHPGETLTVAQQLHGEHAGRSLSSGEKTV